MGGMWMSNARGFPDVRVYFLSGETTVTVASGVLQDATDAEVRKAPTLFAGRAKSEHSACH